MINHKKLMLEQALLIMVSVLSFYIIITNKLGNIFFYPSVKGKMNTYYQQNYQELTKGNIIYHAKDRMYTMNVSDPKNENHAFQIIYHKKKITDTYQQDYIEGNSFFKSLEKKIKKEWDSVFQDTELTSCKITFQKLNTYQKQEQNLLLTTKNPKETKLYQVTCPNQNQSMVRKLAEENHFYYQDVSNQ